MLPPWMGDAATLATLWTAVVAVVGWVLGWLTQGSGAPPPRALGQPQSNTRRKDSVFGSLKTGIRDALIRPDIPTPTEAVGLALATMLLFVGFYLHLSGSSGSIPAVITLRQIGLTLLYIYALVVVAAWARLKWKIDYLNRMRDSDPED